MKKKVLSLVLAAAMALSMSTMAFAADNEVHLTDEGISTASSNLTLTVVEQDVLDILIATVPIELPIAVASDGTVTCSAEAKIINHTSDKTIKIARIKTTLNDEISELGMKSYTDFDTEKAANLIGISILGMDMRTNTNGVTPSTEITISPNEELSLDMKAAVTKHLIENELATTNIGTITFTIEIVE